MSKFYLISTLFHLVNDNCTKVFLCNRVLDLHFILFINTYAVRERRSIETIVHFHPRQQAVIKYATSAPLIHSLWKSAAEQSASFSVKGLHCFHRTLASLAGGVGEGTLATETLCLSVHNDVTQSIWRCLWWLEESEKNIWHILPFLCPLKCHYAYAHPTQIFPAKMDNVFQIESCY